LKLLNVNGIFHLTTFANDTQAQRVEHAGRSIPIRFSHTACARVIGGLPEDKPLEDTTCAVCRAAPVFKQAELLQAMMSE
jgi:hypothetical protein